MCGEISEGKGGLWSFYVGDKFGVLWEIVGSWRRVVYMLGIGERIGKVSGSVVVCEVERSWCSILF